jgi:hypothetical protein
VEISTLLCSKNSPQKYLGSPQSSLVLFELARAFVPPRLTANFDCMSGELGCMKLLPAHPRTQNTDLENFHPDLERKKIKK